MEPETAPNSTTTLNGTFGGVEAPCWCDVPACNHTLEPLHASQVVPTVRLDSSSATAQKRGGGQ